jgi:DNA helicase-2/ATP-dependent DNA helicase PcrA
MTRAMRTLILTRAHYRRRYGNDAPEASIPSRFLEEVPPQLVENLGGNSPAWSTPAYGAGRRGKRYGDDFEGRHYNYEDESQEVPAARSYSRPGSLPKSKSAGASPKSKSPGGPDSIDNIARFFGGGKPGSFTRPALDIPEPHGAAGLKQGQRVRHAKYGEGQIVMREGAGEDAKLTVLFQRHGMKKLMEKFANLEKI